MLEKNNLSKSVSSKPMPVSGLEGMIKSTFVFILVVLC